MKTLYRFCPYLCILVTLGCAPKHQQHFDLAILNGEVLDIESGKFVNRSLFISDGRITRMSHPVSTPAFVSTDTIDATDKYVLPGFWDNHVHFRGGDSLIGANKNFLKLFIANGITNVRDAGGDLTAAVMDWKNNIALGRLLGPNIFTSGPKIDGPASTWAGAIEVANERDIRAALDSLERIPVDFVKIYDSRISPENYLGTIEEAEKRGLITSGHIPFTVTLEETVSAGIDGIEHLYYIMKGCSSEEKEITRQINREEIGFWDAMPLLKNSFNDITAKNTFASLKKNQIFVVPTLHIGETLSYLDERDHTQDAYLNYMGNGIIKTYDGRIDRAINSDEKAISDRKDLDRFFGVLTKKLHEANVSLLAGSDSGAYNSYTYPGISLHKEMEALVKAGLPPIAALKASAYNGALFLKKTEDYGTVEEGKVSDLVILDANPLENISNTQKINTVVKNREIITKKDLAQLLKEAIAN